MQSSIFTPQNILEITALVLAATELIKFSKWLPETWGLGIAAALSALGVGAWLVSTPDVEFTRLIVWPTLVAFMGVLTSAAGVWGFIREVNPQNVTTAGRSTTESKASPDGMKRVAHGQGERDRAVAE